ncbi:hypothetical protein EDD18DRAFT_1425303 [Armillaria luteobubalina]|uniref:Uncharacterized protein n=1 Tax=Armillaria luteobubalina TaxID=153913 RepID=A0AA39UF04_9AGAR|nr:hypothetical protein EDD18DRAFT_1425303 [Armillaria luteobubalina]
MAQPGIGSGLLGGGGGGGEPLEMEREISLTNVTGDPKQEKKLGSFVSAPLTKSSRRAEIPTLALLSRNFLCTAQAVLYGDLDIHDARNHQTPWIFSPTWRDLTASLMHTHTLRVPASPSTHPDARVSHITRALPHGYPLVLCRSSFDLPLDCNISTSGAHAPLRGQTNEPSSLRVPIMRRPGQGRYPVLGKGRYDSREWKQGNDLRVYMSNLDILVLHPRLSERIWLLTNPNQYHEPEIISPEMRPRE